MDIITYSLLNKKIEQIEKNGITDERLLNTIENSPFVKDTIEEIMVKKSKEISGDVFNSFVGYDGEQYDSLEERLNGDFDVLYQKINNSTYLEYEGTNITANDSFVGKQKDTKINGRTLRNLLKLKNKEQRGHSCKDGVLTLVGDGNDYPTIIFETNSIIKSGTTYTFIYEVVENNLVNAVLLRFGNFTENKQCVIGANSYNSTPGLYRLVVTTPTDMTSPIGVESYTRPDDPIGSKGVFKNIMLLEGDHTNTPIEELPFVEGIQSVGDKSKNLFDGRVERGYYGNGGNKYDGTNSIRSVDYISVKPSSTYYFTVSNYSQACYIHCYDNDKNYIKEINTKGLFSTPDNCYYIMFNTHANYYVDLNENVQIEEGAVATAYEPYYDGYKVSVRSCGKNLLDRKSVV